MRFLGHLFGCPSVEVRCLNSSIMFAEHSLYAAKRSKGKADFEIPAGWMLDA